MRKRRILRLYARVGAQSHRAQRTAALPGSFKAKTADFLCFDDMQERLSPCGVTVGSWWNHRESAQNAETPQWGHFMRQARCVNGMPDSVVFSHPDVDAYT